MYTVATKSICFVKVLVPDNGEYAEGRQYKVIPGTESQGASGKATMCQDLSTGKVFIRKTVCLASYFV